MPKWKGLISTVVAVLAVISIAFALERPDLITRPHADAWSVQSTLCITCHGRKTSGSVDRQTDRREVSLDPNIPTFHAIHLDNPLLNLECTTCHESVDLLEGSGAHLRKQVSVETCQICHTDYFAHLHEDRIGGN